ncbi:MAG: 30S ribosomal protein S20 [Patescibacteria group bacterium]
MAITKSAKKALRQSLKKKLRNRTKKSGTKKLLKELAFLVSQKKAKEAKDLLPKAYKAIDKTAKAGLIKKNAADRKKSNLARSVSALK